MPKHVIVTGAAGFIGANLVRNLLRKNYQVHAFVSDVHSCWRLSDIKESIIFHERLLEKQTLKRTIRDINPSAVFHLVTYGSYPSQKNEKKILATNINLTINLLNALRDTAVERIVVSGSSSEYGKKNKPMKESDVLLPNNFYAVAKAAQTHVCQMYAQMYTMPITIIRLFNVYGPYEQKGRLVRSVIESALKNEPILLASGKEARDFIFAEEVASLMIKAMIEKTAPGTIYNAGTGTQTTIGELALAVKQLTKSTSEIRLNAYPGRIWDTVHWVADMTKTNKELLWQHKTSLEDGLKKTIAWYKKQQ